MKKLFDTPSWQAGTARIADFAELHALRSARKCASIQDLVAAMKRSDEEDEDKYEKVAQEAFHELSERPRHLGPADRLYPFVINDDLLNVRKPRPSKGEGMLYFFLLLATRMNMRDERKQADLDATELFELLCLEVAKRYWGGPEDDRVNGLVFGTARCHWQNDESQPVDTGSFRAAVNDLCRRLGEGNHFCLRDAPRRITARDDKLDIAVWRDFSDHSPGKLIGFGQCKTGSNWDDELTKLQPDGFCRKWMNTAPVVTPMKLFFLTDRVITRWSNRGIDAGILFDRCRILDYSDKLPKQILSLCACWTHAAMKSSGITW